MPSSFPPQLSTWCFLERNTGCGLVVLNVLAVHVTIVAVALLVAALVPLVMGVAIETITAKDDDGEAKQDTNPAKGDSPVAELAISLHILLIERLKIADRDDDPDDDRSNKDNDPKEK